MSFVGALSSTADTAGRCNAHAPVSGENRTPAFAALGKRHKAVKHGNGFFRMWKRFKAWHRFMTRTLPFGPNILRMAIKEATKPVELKRALTRKDLRTVKDGNGC